MGTRGGGDRLRRGSEGAWGLRGSRGAAGAPRGRPHLPSPSRAGFCLPTPVTVATARAPPAPRRRRCRRSCSATACRRRPWSFWPRHSAPPAPSTRTGRRDSPAGERGGVVDTGEGCEGPRAEGRVQPPRLRVPPSPPQGAPRGR